MDSVTGEGDGKMDEVTTSKTSGQGKRSRRHRRHKANSQTTHGQHAENITAAETSVHITGTEITSDEAGTDMTGNQTSANITSDEASTDMTGNETSYEASVDISHTDIIADVSSIENSMDISSAAITSTKISTDMTGNETSAANTSTDVTCNKASAGSTGNETSAANTSTDITSANETSVDISGNETSEMDELEDLGSAADLDGDKRNVLYDRGLCLARAGKLKPALKCYLHCLTGLDHANGFTCLPLCLRNVADIYYKQEEYEKAIQFIQAEKLYYETALIDTSELRRKLEERMDDSSSDREQAAETGTEAARADEYEKLAKMCLEKKQPQLALEYQGKATKLRQQVFGEDHPTTAASLDLFTVIYGEAGKQQYSESLLKLGNISADADNEATGDRANITTTDHQATNGTGIVQQANPEDSFEESLEDVREQEECLSRVAVWILFLLCILCLSLIVFYAYCKLDTSSRSCSAWRADMHHYYTRLKYYYYYYVSPDRRKTYV